MTVAPGEPDDARSDPLVNRVVSPASLPRLPDDAFSPVERAHLGAQLGILAVVFAVIVVVTVVLVLAVDLPGWAVGSLLAVVAGFGAASVGLLTISFRHRGWVVREHDISYRSGVVTRRIETVPFSRVQHTSVDAGPLDRMLGLSKLSVFTAGGGGADLVVSGLRHEDALRLRERVSEAAARS